MASVNDTVKDGVNQSEIRFASCYLWSKNFFFVPIFFYYFFRNGTFTWRRSHFFFYIHNNKYFSFSFDHENGHREFYPIVMVAAISLKNANKSFSVRPSLRFRTGKTATVSHSQSWVMRAWFLWWRWWDHALLHSRKQAQGYNDDDDEKEDIEHEREWDEDMMMEINHVLNHFISLYSY